ncbi:hypothetical protein AB0I72_19820 [Nocardiopsis sp. NPDC049922]|uniref:hypothetical protein n=1 Tax=Nocardiopsis sp. NPDC049922 TaxID=3155157 RepID=UPI0033E6ED08
MNTDLTTAADTTENVIPVLPTYHFETTFTRVGSDDHLRVTATGSQTFVTRMAEAAASAFEEEATR